MQAILLAAGYGTRLRPYTDLRAKPLFPVANRPLLDRLLDQLHAAGAVPILVNCHHLADQVEAALGRRPEVLVQRETEILGTGGSLRLAIDRMDNDPVLVVNGKDDGVSILPRAYRFIELFDNAWGYIVPHCGHWAMIEQQDDFCAAVLAFLGKELD